MTSSDSPSAKLLIVTHTEGSWGAEQRLLEFLPDLISSGIACTLAAPGFGDFTKGFEAAGGRVEIVAMKARTGLRNQDGSRPGPVTLLSEAWKVISGIWSLRRLARRHDFLQSHSRTAHLDVAILGRLVRRPVVLDLHDVIAAGVGRKLMTFSARLATVTVANSSSTRSVLTGLDESKVVIVHPAVDLLRFDPARFDPARFDPAGLNSVRVEIGGRADRPLLAILGRVDPEKRIEVLLQAVTMSERRDIDVVVVGGTEAADTTYLEGLKAVAGSIDSSSVCWAGSRSDIPAVLSSVDVVVSTCPVEAFGRSLLEGQAMGVPVIAPDIAGVRDIVREGETGWLFEPEN
ncbi:MAG: glycosyltransferase family 4 protein, partial [Actinobacteria bacterium]|nr:glycosyltransferase family 4 protein [Actinomycetota bacterium]